jgi:hypothetical protein
MTNDPCIQQHLLLPSQLRLMVSRHRIRPPRDRSSAWEESNIQIKNAVRRSTWHDASLKHSVLELAQAL